MTKPRAVFELPAQAPRPRLLGDPRVRVLAADRQPLFLEAVARVVRQRADLDLVAELGEGRGALDLIARAQPDVAVLDERLPGLDGGQVLNAVVRDRLPTRVLLVATKVRSDAVYQALAAGAGGYVSRLTSAPQLADAIAGVAGGHVVLAQEVQTSLAQEIRRRSRGQRAVLGERERQVLLLLAEGLTAAEIGRRLHLSTGTVKTTLLKLYERLGVSERSAAVAVALRRGLIE
jgi:two-component system nitrate/nitrite response regulator NarL